MPPFILILLVCIGLFLLFPKGFKFLVGSWVGVAAGGFAWALSAMVFSALITPGAFAGFIVAGIFGGCVLAAKG